MGLTVAEKTHWRDRLQVRIDRRSEAILAADRGLMDRIRREARSRANASLGLAGVQAELEQIAEQKWALEKRERLVRRAMIARLRGVKPEEVEENCYARYEGEVATALGKRQAVHEDELLAEHEIGRRILQLRSEKER